MKWTVSRITQSVLARDTGWAIGHEGLALIVTIVSFTLLGRRLGPDGYGAFVGLYGLLAPAISVTQSGIGLTIYEHVVGRGESGREVANSSVSNVLVVGSILAVVVLLLSTRLLPELSLGIVALFAVSELIVTSLLLMAIAVVQAVRSFASAARLRILYISLRGVMIVTLAVTDALTLRNLALGQIVIAVAAGVVVLWLVRQDTGSTLRPGSLRRDLLASVGTYSTGIFASTVQSSGDKVALNAAGHVADAGLYGAAYRVIMLAQIPIRSLANSTHLSFLGSAPRDAVGLSLRYSLVAGAYGCLAAIGLAVLAPLLPLLLGAEFEEATSIVRWLAPVVVLAALTPFPSNGLLTYGRNGLRTMILVGNAVFAVALYVALIPPFSWRGAILATVIAETTMTAVAWMALLRVRAGVDGRPASMDLTG